MSQLLERIKRDIEQDVFYRQNFANDGERFVAWYLRNVYLRTPIQARDDMTDGADDKQIDALIVDDEKRRVVIIQGKFYGDTLVDQGPLGEVLSAWMQIHNLPALQENANFRLKVKLEAIAQALQDDYDVELELVTTGTLSRAAQKDLDAFRDAITEFEHPETTIVLVDETILQARWDEAMSVHLPKLSHTISLQLGKYLSMEVANFRTILAAIPLTECLRLPGVRDGTLFRKNVRQSLGLTNKVNRGMKQTITGETPQYFFLYHNGITALCESMQLDPQAHTLRLDGLSVVNGCQSLNTILACSEKVKASNEAYVLFRFYEIPQNDLADKISIYTNTQSAVKPRDLRSNDKRVVALKRAYESTYRDGYLITKRGEERPADRDADKTVDIALLAKYLVTWQFQRPNIAYNENKLFDKHFEVLFRSDYPPVDILALNRWAQEVERRWNQGNLGLNEALLATPSYSKFHLMFAVQACFCAASNQVDKVPMPSATVRGLNTPDPIINMASHCYNAALGRAIHEYEDLGKIFSPQNWLKAKDSLRKVQDAVAFYLGMIDMMPGGVELRSLLSVPADRFMMRWSAD
jgi:hypothetical protein